MERSASGIDESCDFFLAENHWQAMTLLVQLFNLSVH
jgi:hypothetical protein